MRPWRKYTTDADEGAMSFYNEALDVLIEVGMNGAILKISKPVAATTLFEVLANGDVNADGTIAGSGSGSNIVKTDVDDQFSGLTEKASPASIDLLIIESNADGGAKRKVPWSSLPSGGASDFTDLGDVDGNYTGDGLKFVRVKASEDGLEFADVPAEISTALSAIGSHPDSQDFIPIWDDSAGVLKKLGYWDIETQQVHFYVQNNSGITIPKGTAVSVIGANGSVPRVAASDPSSRGKLAIGLAESAMANLAYGWVVASGSLSGLDTSSWIAGDVLYVGSAGALDMNPPADNIQSVGVVAISDASNGRIEVSMSGVSRSDFIKDLYEANSDTNAFTDAEKTKLSNIEANADVTDTANVTAAGALMDSEVTNLAAVKAFDPADYATAAQGSAADSALQPGDVTASDIDSEASTDGYVLTSDGAGGAAWEAIPGAGGGDAWSDPVDSDILPDTDSTRTIGSAINRFINIFLDALNVSGNITVGGTIDGRDVASDGTKLDGIEAGADVTDATNVAAAGALMTADAGALATLDTVDTAQIDADAVTNNELANMSASTVKGRRTASGGDPEDLDADAVSDILDTATDPFVRTSALSGGGYFVTNERVSDTTTGGAYTPTAATDFIYASSQRSIFFEPLTNVTRARIVVRNGGANGGGSATVRLLYRTAASGYSTTVGDYTQFGASGHIEAAITNNTQTDSGWVNIAALAKADVNVAVVVVGANGSTSVALQQVQMFFDNG